MAVSQQVVVTCDHDSCAEQVRKDGTVSGDDLLAWLDSSGWVQFKAKRGASTAALNFCPTHQLELRQFFGSLDSTAGLALTQGKTG